MIRMSPSRHSLQRISRHEEEQRGRVLQALQKRHSTTEEALEIARSSGAYRTILTHFSQRSPKIPAGLDLAGAPPASCSATRHLQGQHPVTIVAHQ